MFSGRDDATQPAVDPTAAASAEASTKALEVAAAAEAAANALETATTAAVAAATLGTAEAAATACTVVPAPPHAEGTVRTMVAALEQGVMLQM